MKGRYLLDRYTAKRVVKYAKTLADEAANMTAVERREIADVLQAEGLAVGRWRTGHTVSGLLIVTLAIMAILGAIDVDQGTFPSAARAMLWVGEIGLAFAAGAMWKLAGRAIDYPLGMYGVTLRTTILDPLHQDETDRPKSRGQQSGEVIRLPEVAPDFALNSQVAR